MSEEGRKKERKERKKEGRNRRGRRKEGCKLASKEGMKTNKE